MIEEAAQTALDTADTLLGILDRMDGDTGGEDADEAEYAPAAAQRVGREVVALRRNDGAQEPEPANVVPVAAAERTVLPFAALPWRGSGNVVAAAGVALLNMVGGR